MTHTNPTTAEVQEILDTSLDTASLQAHIDASEYEVEDIAAADNSVSNERLTDIHKYLAAYFATGQDPRATSQSAESRSINYADDNADYLSVAQRLDPTGSLLDSGKRKASLSVPDSKNLHD